MDMQGKRVLVMGMARSGIAAAELLARSGATAVINDKKTEEQLDAGMAALHIPGVEWRLGEDAAALVDECDCLVVSPGIPDTHPAVAKARAAGKEVLAEIELAYRCFAGTVAAVTGTNGKTTTTTLLTEICKNAGRKANAVGNIGVPFSGICIGARLEDIAVCEVSSFQLETVSTFRPRVAAILNLTPDHLNRHGTMEAYAALKERVFANMRGGDVLVLNADDPIVSAMAARAKCRVVYFSRLAEPAEGAFVRDGDILWRADGEERPLGRADEIYIPGEHNLENALAASAMAMALGLPAPVIRHTLRTFKGVEHRIETVRTVGGVTYINDSKGTNADSTIRAVRAMRAPTALIAGGSEKKQDFAELCREICMSQVREVVLIGLVAPQMERQLREAGFTAVHNAGTDFEAAIRLAGQLIGPGGNVLLSPANASFDMFRDYEHRGAEFKRIVAELGEA